MTLRINHTDGILTVTDANTTIGYCRYAPSGVIEYLFVNPGFRRRGHARQMLTLVETHLGLPLQFAPPISPLGRHVIDAYTRQRPQDKAATSPRVADCGSAPE